MCSLEGLSTIWALSVVDYVITDYSTVAFEAGLLSKKVLFYVPDIEEYRCSPGLNVDPVRDLPSISYTDADSLGAAVADDRVRASYDAASLKRFMRSYGMDELPLNSTERIVALGLSPDCKDVQDEPMGGHT